MSEQDMQMLMNRSGVVAWRLRLSAWIEAKGIQRFIIAVILLNSVILGMETSATLMAQYGVWLKTLDKICLAIFIVELVLKLLAYRGLFWRNGWNVFDFFVVAVALVPGAGVWAVLRSLRVLRVLRLLTVVPQLRKVVAAFLHSIPGLSGVVLVMMIFFYTAAVLATNLFGETHPEWFGTMGRSFYSLFQIMTLESWSMGIVRPVMEVHPHAWIFFVPFIVIATFTILNLFIGIIVSTMQELAIPAKPKLSPEAEAVEAILESMERQMEALRARIRQSGAP